MPRHHIPSREKDGLIWCPRCWQFKPRGEFYKDKQQPIGCKAYCKDCQRKRRMEGGSEHQAYKAYQHQYYLDHKDTLLPKHRITARESIKRRKAK